MLFNGFRFYSESFTGAFSVFPPRPLALLGRNRSPADGITYWHRPHTSRTKLPIVFLHGIGIGLYPYVNFLDELKRHGKDADGEVGIIAIELLSVSFRITPRPFTSEEMRRAVLAILDHHGIHDFVLVSHSYVPLFAPLKKLH